jgi:hypothetical protein
MIRYTKADMKKLHDMSAFGSPAQVYTQETKFSPKLFKQVLESYGLKKDIELLFELPLSKVGLLINRGEVSGYLKFRLQVGK